MCSNLVGTSCVYANVVCKWECRGVGLVYVSYVSQVWWWSFKRLKVIKLSKSLSLRHIFFMDNPSTVKEADEQGFDFRLAHSRFLFSDVVMQMCAIPYFVFLFLDRTQSSMFRHL